VTPEEKPSSAEKAATAHREMVELRVGEMEKYYQRECERDFLAGAQWQAGQVAVAMDFRLSPEMHTLLADIREFFLGLEVRCNVMDGEFRDKIVDRSHLRMMRGQARVFLDRLPIGDAALALLKKEGTK
jgi:hypothetical protein